MLNSKQQLASSYKPLFYGGLLTMALFLLISLHPPYGLWALAFVALIPLIYLSTVLRPRQVFCLTFVAVFLYKLISVLWIYFVEPFKFFPHGIVLTSIVALPISIWVLAISKLHQYVKPSFVFNFTASSIWLLLEYLVANSSFLSFPWNTLAHSQSSNTPLLQWASIFGEYGISFFVVWVNCEIFFWREYSITRKVKGGVFVLIVFSLGYLMSFTGANNLQSLRVAVVQPSFLRIPAVQEQNPAHRVQRLIEITDLALEYQPDLVVWPEGAVRGEGRNNPEIQTIKNYLKKTGVDLVFGYTESEKFSQSQVAKKSKQAHYNQAVFLNNNDELFHVYKKRRLVPFSETMPLKGWLTWPEWLAPKITEMEPGNDTVLFRSGAALIAPIICWENIFSSTVREGISNDTNMVVDIVNDNWFGKTIAATQHNVASIFRAVENGVPVVIASNTGPSEIINHKGKVLAKSKDIFEQTFLVADIPLNSSKTIYYFIGDLFVCFCVLVMLLLLLKGARKPLPVDKVSKGNY